MKPLDDERITVCLRLSLDAYASLMMESRLRGVSSGEALSRLLGGEKPVRH